MDFLAFLWKLLSVLMIVTFQAVISLETYLRGFSKIAILLTNIGIVVSIMLLVIGHCIWQNWLDRRYVERVDEIKSERVEVLGQPRFDVNHGIVLDIPSEGIGKFVVLEPSWWHLLSPSSFPAVSRDKEEEALISTSMVCKVSNDAVPACVVVIKNQDSRVVGMGSRVSVGKKTFLLTAHHVWDGNSTELWLCRNGKKILLPDSLEIEVGSSTLGYDSVFVDIPLGVWAKLGVKAAPLKALPKQSIVTVYGGDSSESMFCSTGKARYTTKVGQLEHTASTIKSWSGSPLISKGVVVGIHLSCKKVGETNGGYSPIYLWEFNQDETEWGDVGVTEVSLEEVERRFEPFDEVELFSRKGGKQHILVGNKEFALNLNRDGGKASQLGPRWADQGDDGDEFFDDLSFLEDIKRKNASLETVEEHLNLERAAAPVKGCLPPSYPSVGTSLNKAANKVRECPSLMLASHLSNLEKQSKPPLQKQSARQAKPSPNCKIIPGPKEGLKQNGNPSSSKQAASDQPKPLQDLMKQFNILQDAIRRFQVNEALGGENGTFKKSKKRSRKSRKRSTDKPAPESLSESSGHPTVKS